MWRWLATTGHPRGDLPMMPTTPSDGMPAAEIVLLSVAIFLTLAVAAVFAGILIRARKQK